MFESTGLQSTEPTEEEIAAAAIEEHRLRWLEPFNKLVGLPLAAVATGIIFIITDLPGFLGIPVFCGVYGVLGVLTLWTYDQIVPPPAKHDFSDYFLLGLEVAKNSFVLIVVAIVVGLACLFMPF